MQPREDILGLDRLMAVAADGEVFPLGEVGDLFRQLIGREQVAHSDGLLHILIRINGADAAAGGAELLILEAFLFHDVLHLVPGQADDRFVADLQVVGADMDAFIAQGLYLVNEVLKVDDHAVAHDVHCALAGNAGGEQVQDNFTVVVYNGVSRVVAALIAADYIIIGAEQIDHAALALIAPVDTYNGC